CRSSPSPSLRRRRRSPAKEAAALCDQQLPRQGAPTPTIGPAAPTSGRAGHWRPPLWAGRNRSCPGWLPLAGYCPCWRSPIVGAGRNQSCPRVAAPCRLLPLLAVAHYKGPGRSRSPLCRKSGHGRPPL
ncbi:hypothetical protein BHE74_00049551, partial [Ensete ventricosum]